MGAEGNLILLQIPQYRAMPERARHRLEDLASPPHGSESTYVFALEVIATVMVGLVGVMNVVGPVELPEFVEMASLVIPDCGSHGGQYYTTSRR